MRSNLFKLTLASAAIAAVAMAAIPAVAETATLKVPFNFTVNGSACPAGVYTIQRDGFTNIVRLQARESSQNFAWIAGPGADNHRVVLSFDRIGETHFLRTVQSGTLVTHRLDSRMLKSEAATEQVTPGQ